MRQPWNEHAVACGLQAGDRDAWALLFEHHSERVWRYVARLIGGDRAGVADIVQETFLAAAQSARSYQPDRGTLGQWLLGIAHRQTAQHRRRFDRALNSSGNETIASIIGRDVEPAAWLEQRELADIVRHVLTELPADYAVLLVGKYSDGRSVEELVTEHGGTTESVRSKLARARREFQSVFERFTKPCQPSAATTPKPH
ncbi:MAG TPA: sigma-70 family RNA polymerase sigma factor [Planctomycetaceae bacterium]|nr:sigma-70 family RNA polymerase sigma factor [Planctomycetaceae bacterium]